MTLNGVWKGTAEAAEYLCVSQRMVTKLIKQGKLGSRPKNPDAERKTYLVYWPDVIAYDRSRLKAA